MAVVSVVVLPPYLESAVVGPRQDHCSVESARSFRRKVDVYRHGRRTNPHRNERDAPHIAFSRKGAELEDNIVGTDEELTPLDEDPQSHVCDPFGGYRLKLRSPSRGHSEYGDSDDEGAPFDASPHTGTWARHRALRMPAMRLRYVSRSICPDP